MDDEYIRRVTAAGRVSWIHKGKIIAAAKVPEDVRQRIELIAAKSKKSSPKRSPVGKTSPPRSRSPLELSRDYWTLYNKVDLLAKEAELLVNWKYAKGDAKAKQAYEKELHNFIRRVAVANR